MWRPLVNVIIIVNATMKEGKEGPRSSSFHGVSSCATMAIIASWQQVRKKTKGKVVGNRILPIIIVSVVGGFNV
jgi:hypothetical protein